MADILTLEPEPLIDKHVGRERVDRYFELLMAVNQKINLVSRETTRADFDRMVAESLFPLEFLPERSTDYMDIGSGGGIPSIPILLSGAVEGKSILVERTVKKARALQTLVAELGLTAEVRPNNFEELTDLPPAGLASLRYVKLNDRLLAGIMARLSPGGKFVYYSSPEFPITEFHFATERFVCPQSSVVKAVTVFSI